MKIWLLSSSRLLHSCSCAVTGYVFDKISTFLSPAFISAPETVNCCLVWDDYACFKIGGNVPPMFIRLRYQGLGRSHLLVLSSRVKDVALQSFNTQVLPHNSQTRVFFPPPHTTLSSDRSYSCDPQTNNTQSGASPVRLIFTVYVGFLCVMRDGYWVQGCIALFLDTD